MESGGPNSRERNVLPVIGEELKLLARTSSASALGVAHGNNKPATGRHAMIMRAASFGAVPTTTVEEPSSHDDNQGEDDPATPVSGYSEVETYVETSPSQVMMEPTIHVRRRFYSSDVVARGRTGGAAGSGDSFHDTTKDFENSPSAALRQWSTTGDGNSLPRDMISSPLRYHHHHHQRRRAQSSDLPTTGHPRPTNGHRRAEYTARRSFERDYSSSSRTSIPEEIVQYGGSVDSPSYRSVGEDDEDAGGEADSDDDDSDHNFDSSSEANYNRSRRCHSEDSNRSSLSGCSSFYSNPIARSYESASHEEPASVEKLLNLQKLYQEGFITVTEYKDRRHQLVDELTVSDKTIHRTTDLIQTGMPVVHRDPPDFTLLRERDAIKHVFDSEKRKWTSSRIKVKIDPQPFARGGLRQVFHLQDLSVIPRLAPEGRPVSYVAKIAIDVNEDPDTYFRDVEMQAVASKFAKLYNSYKPPRRVEFLNAWILQLAPIENQNNTTTSTGSCSSSTNDDNLTMRGTICGVEPYIAGEYHKHNNNFGYVSELERNTPQTFSHFTFEASGRQMLIVDIQGVSDHYTDPQIHTRSGKEFGKGNLAVRGFERFLESHRCNPICRYLKLPLINPKDQDDHVGGNGGAACGDGSGSGNNNGGARNNDGKGTVPAQTYMSQPRVRIKRVDSELCHYYGDSKAFKKYQAKHQSQQQLLLDKADDKATSAFVAALKEQRNCSSFCGVGACTIS